MDLKINDSKAIAAFLLIALPTLIIFSFALFGAAGIRIVFGVIFVSAPFYLILNRLKLTQGEKLVFSILLGFALFPSLAYLLGLLISFRIAIAATFAVLVIASILFNKYINPKRN